MKDWLTGSNPEQWGQGPGRCRVVRIGIRALLDRAGGARGGVV